jgi:hypothetical protein
MHRLLRPRRTSVTAVDSNVLLFVSRAEQLRLRERRNYNRYMLVVKKFVAADSPERLQWQRESAEESRRDVVWSRRHGKIAGGASILPWRGKDEDGAPPSAYARCIGGRNCDSSTRDNDPHPQWFACGLPAKRTLDAKNARGSYEQQRKAPWFSDLGG